MAEEFLYRSAAGVDHFIETDAEGTRFRSSQEVDPFLDLNKAMASHNDGYSPSRELRRVASIPMGLIYHWKVTEGWDAFDPEHAHKLAEKLNSIEFRYLRTADGRVGVSNGVMR